MTIDNEFLDIKQDNRIEELVDKRSRGEGIFIRLKPGYFDYQTDPMFPRTQFEVSTPSEGLELLKIVEHESEC